MNLLQFKELVSELVAFLKVLSSLYPNRLTPDLLKWLESFEQHDWHLEDLHEKFKNVKEKNK